MTAEQWINNCNVEPRRISLKPQSMKAGKKLFLCDLEELITRRQFFYMLFYIIAVGEIGAGFFKDRNSDKPSTEKVKEKATKSSVSFTNRFNDGFENGDKKQAEQVVNIT